MGNSTARLSIEIASSQTGDGLKGTTDDLGNVSDKGEETGKTLEKVGIAIGAVGVGVTAYAKNATDFTTNLLKSSKDLSRETGTTIEQGSQLVYVAQRMGVSSDQASTSFGIFSKKIVAATQDTADAAQAHAELQNKIDKTKLEIQLTTAEIQKNGDKTGELSLKIKTLNTDLTGQQAQLAASQNQFEKLGIKVTDAQGNTRSFNDILLDTADKFKGMKDGSEKTTVAMDLFGRSGKDMIPILNQGSQGIQQLEQQADKLGLTLTSGTVASISKYINSQKDLTDSQNALKVAIGTTTAPILTEFNTKLATTVNSLLNTNGALRTVTIGALAFGGPVLTAGGSALALAGNLTQVGSAGLLAAAKFGIVGLAVAGLTAATGYLAYNVYDTARASGSATQGMNTWQGAILSAVPFIGTLTTSTAAMAGEAQSAAYQQVQLKIAHDNTTKSQQEAKIATDNLASAQLAKTGSDLAVEQAQLNYNNAVAQYGPNSLQARQAAYDLQVAQDAQKDASNRAKDATDAKAKKDAEVAKNKDLENHMYAGRDAADAQTTSIWGAIKALLNWNDTPVQKKSSGGGGGGGGGGGFAAGGPVSAGIPILVGENPDGSLNATSEIFVPNSSGTIIPAKATQSLLGGGNGGSISIIQNNTFTRDTDALAAARQLAFELSRR